MPMPMTRREFLSASAAALLTLPSGGEAATISTANFRRGGSIHSMMNWGTLRDGDPQHYVPRPFETPRNDFPAAFTRDFARSGFDFIRLTLDVGPFMQLQGADRQALERKLIDNIGLFHDLGLAVIVDCHPVEQVQTYSPQSILDDLEGPLFVEYTSMIGRLATLLSDFPPGRVALELMNEPTMRDTGHRTQVKVWGAAQLVLHDAARRAAVDLPLLLTGADYGGISGLRDLDPSPFIDSNTLFSFHYYMPLSFTHQGTDFGVPDAPASPYAVGLPYPYDAVPPKDIAAAIEERIAADTKLDAAGKDVARSDARRILAGFLSDAWNRARIESDFASVGAWADRNGIARQRIILGEFAATRRVAGFTGADTPSRLRWLSDVTHLAQAGGFGWALWGINGRDMGIDKVLDSGEIDPDIVDQELVAALAMSS